MEPSKNSHPSSYRDPSGFIFYHDNILYRQVNQVFKPEFDQFVSSGLYNELTAKKWLIPHEEIRTNLTGDRNWYITLCPQPIPFISYPWEWSFDMLKDAALLTMDILEAALEKNFILKDATSYNIQWLNGRPIFIDTLSFEPYDESLPWIAYRQFCEQFLGPLLLMHYRKMPLHHMYAAYPEGMPVGMVSKLLPGKTKFSIHTYLHIHLNAKYSQLQPGKKKRQTSFSKKKLRDLISSLRLLIGKLGLPDSQSTWSAYYEEASRRNNYLDNKKQLVDSWLGEISDDLQLVADLGANDGEFSQLVAERNIFCVAADLDPYCINRLYKKNKEKKEEHILPLVLDLSNPSPAIGFNNEERDSFLDRCKADGVIALALVHHLAIGKNIPLEKIATLFHLVTKKWLIMEFVPKNDEKLQLMLQEKKDIYTEYTETAFEQSMGAFFRIVKKQKVAGSVRTLYLFSILK